MMKPIYIFSPYWMGDFSPSRAAVSRHNWRLIAPPPTDETPTERMGHLGQMLADEVATVRANGHLPIVIAGDCPASIGVLAGLQRETPAFSLVWYDAHGDFNTPQTSPSGFIGGMPLAMLCGYGEQTIVEKAGATLQPEANIILTDARDLDPGEDKAIAASALTHLPDVADLLTLDLPDQPLYIHFDCDVLRTDDLSAVNYPAKGGASLETIEATLTRLADTGQVAVISVTMWDPALTEDGTTQAEQTLMGPIERLVERVLAIANG